LPVLVVPAAGDEAIVFPDKAADKYGTYGTSLPQPKDSSSNHGDTKAKDGAKPRFGYDTGGMSTKFNFGVQPKGGGISGSASFSSSYGGHGQAQGHTASQSHSFNFQAGSNGFSASQAGSQSSSFNSQFPGYYGYEAGNNNTHNNLYIYIYLYRFTLFILCIQKFLIGYFPMLIRNVNTQIFLY
jgi:hypothetical protein